MGVNQLPSLVAKIFGWCDVLELGLADYGATSVIRENAASL
jgi:hypothetical protein